MPINERQKPYRTTQEEQQLRWEYGQGNMTLAEFNVHFEELKRQGKIVRDGRKVVTDE